MVEIAGQIVVVGAEIDDPALPCSIDYEGAGVGLRVDDHIFRSGRRRGAAAREIAALDSEIDRARLDVGRPGVTETCEVVAAKYSSRRHVELDRTGLWPLRPDHH